jgi:hypothetical protein
LEAVDQIGSDDADTTQQLPDQERPGQRRRSPTTTRMVARTAGLSPSRAPVTPNPTRASNTATNVTGTRTLAGEANREQRYEGANGEREHRHPSGVPGADHIVLGDVQLKSEVRAQCIPLREFDPRWRPLTQFRRWHPTLQPGAS